MKKNNTFQSERETVFMFIKNINYQGKVITMDTGGERKSTDVFFYYEIANIHWRTRIIRCSDNRFTPLLAIFHQYNGGHREFVSHVGNGTQS